MKNEALFGQHLKLAVRLIQLFYLSNPKLLNLIQNKHMGAVIKQR